MASIRTAGLTKDFGDLSVIHRGVLAASQADSASSILVTRSLENPYGIRVFSRLGSPGKIALLAHVGRYRPLLAVL